MPYGEVNPEMQRIRGVQVRATSKPFWAESHPATKSRDYLQIPAKKFRGTNPP
jgi:hypothetical protein